MHRLALLSCAVAVSTSVACGSTSSETTVGPTPVRCGVTLGGGARNFPHSGGSGSLTVAAARECSWSASTQTAWISIANPKAGQGDGSVTFTVDRNPAASVRRGTVTVGGQSAEVTQEAAPCTFELDRRSFDVAAAGGESRVEVRAPDGCSWEASSAVAWITIAEGAQGNGGGTVRFTVEANSVPSPRTGRVNVAGLAVTVRQTAAGAPPPPPGPGDCTFAVEPASADIGSAQTDGTFALLTDETCAWSAASDAGWLTIVAGGTGTGPGEVMYRAAENAGSSGRTGHITVGNAVFTLVQQGQAPICDYGLDPASQSFGSEGGSGEFDVDTGALCAWSAEPLDSWIRITSGSAGLGDGEVDYEVDPNPGDARTGRIRVAGLDFTVTQSASLVTVTGDVRDLSGSCPDTAFTVGTQPVRTTGSTDFRGGSCANQLEEGTRVRVTGPVGGGGVLTANEVRFVDD